MPLLAASLHGAQRSPLVGSHRPQLSRVDARHRAATVGPDSPWTSSTARTSSVIEQRSVGDDPPGQRRLADAGAAHEGDGAAGQRHRAGVQHVRTAQHRGQRQDLSQHEAFPAPRRSCRWRGDDAPAVRRDEVAPVARRPDAKADLLVALDGKPDASVDEPAFQQGVRARRSPAAVDGGCGTRAPATCRRDARVAPARRSPAGGRRRGQARTRHRTSHRRCRCPPCDDTATRMPLTEDDRSGAALPARAQPTSGDVADPLLEVEGLRKTWPGRAAPTLDDLDLELNGRATSPWSRGATAPARPRCCGSSAGWWPPKAAACTSRGSGWATNAAPTSARSACLTPGDRGLYARVTVQRNLDLWARLALLDASARAAAIELLLHALRSRRDRRAAGRPPLDGSAAARPPGLDLPPCADARPPGRAGHLARHVRARAAPRRGRRCRAARRHVPRGRSRGRGDGARSRPPRSSCATDDWSRV